MAQQPNADLITKITTSGSNPSQELGAAEQKPTALKTCITPSRSKVLRLMPKFYSAAETFTDAYYTALQAARHTLSSYYVAKETFPDDQVVPSITWNGNVFNDANDYQRMWEDQMPTYSYFEVQCLDCQVLNPNPPLSKEEKAAASQVDTSEGGPAGVTVKKGKKDEEHIITSMLVVVSGFVRLEERNEGPQRGFSEVFILVPNMDVTKANEGKRWLIQTQNFRYVV